MNCFACGEELRWDNTCRSFGCAQWGIPVAVPGSERWMIMSVEADEVLVRWEADPEPELWYKVVPGSRRDWATLASPQSGWQEGPSPHFMSRGTPVSPLFRDVVDAIENLRE